MKLAAAAILIAALSSGALAQTASPEGDRCDNYITAAFARKFANEWVAAWNSHNLDRVLEHYTDDFEMSSPFIITSKVGDPGGTLRGKAKVGAYWEKGIAAQNFVLIDVFAGAHSIAIHYERLSSPVGTPNRIAVETEEFNAECKVVRSNAMYGGRQ